MAFIVLSSGCERSEHISAKGAEAGLSVGTNKYKGYMQAPEVFLR